MTNFISILPFLLAGLFMVSILLVINASRNRETKQIIQNRISEARKQGAQTITQEQYNLFESEHEKLLQTRLDDFFKDLSKRRGVKTSYFQKLTAGVSTGAAMLILLSACAILLLVLSQVMVLSPLETSPYAIIGGLLVTVMVLKNYQNRREKEFLTSFPLAFDIVARGLKSGGTIEKTFKTVAEQIEGPVGKEFTRINQEMDFGVPFDEAMVNAAGRIQIDDFSFFTIALIIQRKAGGSLSDLVANISAFLRKRQELRLKVKALSAEAKATGMIVGSLPVVILVVMYFVNPETVEILRFNPSGRKLSLFLIVYMATGIWIIKKMTNIKV
jgi:tight adherence protein B